MPGQPGIGTPDEWIALLGIRSRTWPAACSSSALTGRSRILEYAIRHSTVLYAVNALMPNVAKFVVFHILHVNGATLP